MNHRILGLSAAVLACCCSVEAAGPTGALRACSVVVLCNARSAITSSLALRVVDVYLADQFSNPVEESGEATVPPGTKASTARSGKFDPPRLTRFVGTYLLDGEVIEIALAPQGLTCSVLGGPAHLLTQLDEPRISVTQRPWILTFSAEDEDKASSLEFQAREGAKREVFKRVKPLTPSAAVAFLGRYRSDEVPIVYRITHEDGFLRVRLEEKGGRLLLEVPLLRVREHLFTNGNKIFFRFEVDSNGAISGFSLQDSRVESVHFTRVVRREVLKGAHR